MAFLKLIVYIDHSKAGNNSVRKFVIVLSLLYYNCERPRLPFVDHYFRIPQEPIIFRDEK